jgi:hypothetical protein
MAQKQLDDSDWGRDLDYDFPDPFAPVNQRTNRGVIARATSSFAAGARDAFKSPAMIGTIVSNALPRGYGSVYNFAEERYREAEELYNTASREMEPAMPALRRIVQRNLPKLKTYTPKFTHDAWEEFGKPREQYKSMTAAEQNEQDLKDSLASVFEVKDEIDARYRAEDRVERMVLHGQNLRTSRKQVQHLAAIQAGVAQLNAYNDQVNNRVQRRMLELQTRSFYLQRDQFRLQVETARRTHMSLVDLVKNTAMPDIAKQNIMHSATNSFRQRLLGNLQDSAGAYAKRFMGDTFKRLRDNVKDLAGMGRDGIMGSEMADDMPLLEVLMQAGGGMAAEGAVRMLSGPVRQWLEKKYPQLAQKGARANRFIRNIPQKANKWARTATSREGLGGLIEEIIKDQIRTHRLDTSIGRHGLDAMDKPASWDKLSRKTLVEIIPGLLSRIEHNTARVLDPNAKRQVYNIERGKFTTMSEAAKDITRRIAEPEKLAASRRDVEDFIKALAGGRPISSNTMREFSRQIQMDSAEGVEFDINRYINPGINTPELSPTAKAELSQIFSKSGRRQDGSTDHVWMDQMDEQFNNLNFGSAIPSSAAGVYVSAGMQELLEEAGLLEFEGFRPKLKVSKFLDMVGSASFDDIKMEKRSATDRLKDMATDKAKDFFGTKGRELKDLYVAGGSKAVLQAGKLRAGQYADAATGKILEKWEDVKGAVRDLTTNEVVIDPSVLSHGLVDLDGKVYTFNVSGAINKVASGIRDVFRRSEPPPIPEDGAFDVVNGATGDVLLSGTKMRNGDYKDAITNETIDSVDKIAGPVVDETGETVVTTGDLAKLARRGGEFLRGVVERAKARAQSILGRRRAIHQAAYTPSNAAAADGTMMQATFAEGPELIRLNSEQLEVLKAIAGLLATQGQDGEKAGMFRKGILDTIFVKGVGGAWAGAKGLGKGMWAYTKGIYSGLFSGARGITKVGTSITGAIMDKTMDVLRGTKDIYVQGVRKPALTAQKIKLGQYRDENSGKKIRSWRDVTGPVTDLVDGSTALSQEDFDKGIFAKGPNGLVRLALTGAGKLTRTVLGGYAGIFGAPFKILGAAGRAVGDLAKWTVNKQVDVYVKGEREPRLKASKMKSGLYYNANDKKPGKVVRDYDDIHGEIKELPKQGAKASATDKTVLYDSEIHDPGLVGRWGMPLKTPAMKVLTALAGAAGSVVKGAAALFGGAMKGYGKLFGGLMGLGGGMLGAPFKFLGALLNPFEKHGAKQVDLLEKIYKLLDKRMPGAAPRKGSWQEQFAKKEAEDEKKKEAEEKKAEEKKGPVAALMSWIANKSKGLFGGSSDEDEGDEDSGDGGGNTYYMGGDGGDEKDKKGKKGENKNEKGKTQEKGKNNRRGGKGRRRAGRGGPPPIPKGNPPPIPKGKAGALARLFRGGKGLLSKGKGLFSAKGLMITSVLAGGGGWLMDKFGVGKDSAARGALDKGAEVADTAMTARMVAQGGMWGARAVGLAGTASTAGGAAAAGGGAAAAGGATAAAGGAAATAAGGTAAAAGGTVAVGTAPAWAIPAAIAAAVIGQASLQTWQSYRGARYGKFNPIRAFRFAQYGIESNNRSLVEKVVKLEEKLAPHIDQATGNVSTSLGGGDDFTMNDAYELFGIHDGMMWFGGSSLDRGSFQTWYANRFLPVYTQWIIELNKIDPSKKVSGENFKASMMTSSLDMMNDTDKLPPESRLKLVNSVWNGVSRSVYAVLASPTGDPADIIDDPNKIEQAYLLAVKSCNVDGKGGPLSKRFGDKLNKLADMAPTQFRMQAQWAAEWYNNKLVKKEGLALQNQELANKAGGTESLKGKILLTKPLTGLLPPLLGRADKITPLQAIRLRTYGLAELEIDRVRALIALEMFVAKNTQLASDGSAYYNMDTDATYSTACAFFGLTPNTPDDRERWGIWFNKRFLPTAIAYIRSADKIAKNVDLTAPEKTLKGEQLVQMAQDIMAAKDDDGRSVWYVTISPWSAQEKLLTDQAATTGSLLALRSIVSKKVMSETKVDGLDAQAANKKGMIANMLDAMGRGQAKVDDFLGGKSGERNWLGRQIDRVKDVATTVTDLGSQAYNQAKAGDWSGAATSAASAALAPGQAVYGALTGGTAIQHPGGGTGGDINSLPQIPSNQELAAMPVKQRFAALKPMLDAVAKMTGTDPNMLYAMCMVESSFNPLGSPGTSAAQGLYQFIPGTWRQSMAQHASKYGIAPGTGPLDSRANAIMGALYLKSNYSYVSKKVKKPLTATDMYMAHFLGPEGAAQFLNKDPNENAVKAFPRAAAANAWVFYESKREGKRMVPDYSRPRTIGAVYADLQRKMLNAYKGYGGDAGLGGQVMQPTGTAPAAAGKADFSGVTASVDTTGNKPNVGNDSAYPPTTTTTTANAGGGVNPPKPETEISDVPRQAPAEATDMQKTGGGILAQGAGNGPSGSSAMPAPDISSTSALSATSAAQSSDEAAKFQAQERERAQRAETLRQTEIQNRYESQVSATQQNQSTQLLANLVEEARQTRINTGDIVTLLRMQMNGGKPLMQQQGSSQTQKQAEQPQQQTVAEQRPPTPPSSARLESTRPTNTFNGGVPIDVRHQ